MDEDPLARRLRDKTFARAYRSWLRLLIKNAVRRPSRRPVVTFPRGESLRPPKTLAG